MQIRLFLGRRGRVCRLAAVAGLLPGLAACSQRVSGAGYPAVGGTAAVRLAATLVDPMDVDLQWPAADATVDGYFVEYAQGPRDSFRLLATVPSTVTTFRHATLSPQTTFLYRVRPYSGRPSRVAEVVAGEADAMPPAEAADAELVARSLSPTSVELRWKAHAGGDGYVVEQAATLREPFRVAAVLEPDATSYVASGVMPHGRCYFRIRAFAFGAPSNVVERTTLKKASAEP